MATIIALRSWLAPPPLIRKLRGLRRASVTVPSFPVADNTRAIAFLFAVIALAVRLASAAGGLTYARRIAFYALFAVPDDEREKTARLLRIAETDTREALHYARRIASLYPGDTSRRLGVMDRLFRLAEIEGPIAPAELALLRRVHRAMKLGSREWQHLYHRHIAPLPIDPYRLLGVEESANDEALKQAYRRHVRLCHPDALAAAKASRAAQAKAATQMAVLNAAYDAIMRARGRKQAS